MKHLILAATAAFVLAAPALAQAAETAAPAAAASAAAGAQNVIATAKSDGEFTTFTKAVEAAGLTGELAGAGPYTVFAPTDAAFAKLPAGTLETLMQPAHKAELRTLVQNHVVSGQAKAEYFAGKSGEMTSLGGTRLALDGSSGVKVNGATVVKADITASNGVIHAIDTVLLAPAPEATAAATPVEEQAEGDGND